MKVMMMVVVVDGDDEEDLAGIGAKSLAVAVAAKLEILRVCA